MSESGFIFDAHKLPAPFDREGAAQRLSEWREHVGSITREDRDLGELLSWSESTEGEALLLSIFGNSPYLSRSLEREPVFLQSLLREGPDAALESLLSGLRESLPQLTGQQDLMKELRIGKRLVALLTALADIAGVWSLEQVTGALSDFADLAVDHAVAFLLHSKMKTGELAWPNGEEQPPTPEIARQTGYFVLAMGKLGARELNYSSDIDLIVFFENERVKYTGKRDIQDCFIKVTQELVKILQQRTGDGYVFRTDLRLRPDAGATAVALSVDAAEVYYQSTGLNWERAAMIKARVHAGDLEAGQAFLRDLRPFVWRKHLDFAALEDIHAMKSRIHSHHNHKALHLPGQDIKLGPGGIREIEFFAQAHQMIAGGREPELRYPRTLDALSQLVELDRIKPEVRDQLEAAYRYLRSLEHRLQMIRDEQTQILPSTEEGLEAVAIFMGEPDLESFKNRLMGHLKTVQHHYDELFRDPYAQEGDGDDLSTLFTSEVIDEDTLGKIRALGFEDPERAAAIIRAWESGRYRACRTDRARKLLKELTPAILASLGQTAGPDRALLRFDEFLGKLPSGVQLFSLFQANPNLLDLLADILGSAPALADFLGRNHLLLDAVLSPDFFDPMPDLDELKGELDEALAPARDFQDILDLSRRWTNDRKFQIGVLTMRNVIDVNQAEAYSSDVAEAVMDRLLPHVQEEFAKQHGRIPDSGLILVAMGSFGGRSISFSSDLDMIFLYDAPDASVESDGDRPLAVSQYYMRLSQRFINAVTALTGEGRLYEIDMRLRPSGNQGPLAVSLRTFEEYHRDTSWTWEHMALTRARVISGPQKDQERTRATIEEVLTRPRDPERLLRAVADMRGRLEKEFGTENPWDTKHVRGGLMDLEFIAQYLQLRHGAEHPEIFSPHTSTSIRNLKAAGLIQRDIADELLDAIYLQGVVRTYLRQIFGEKFDPQSQTAPGIRTGLARAAKVDDFAELESALLTSQKRVKEIYDELIEIPASDLPKADEGQASEETR